MSTIDSDLRDHLGPDAVPQSIERNPLLMAVRNPVLSRGAGPETVYTKTVACGIGAHADCKYVVSGMGRRILCSCECHYDEGGARGHSVEPAFRENRRHAMRAMRRNPLLMSVSNPGPVEVTFVDQTGTKTVRARVGSDVAVRSILPAIITRMGLPVTSPDGQAMSYSLDHKEGGVRLLEDQTLGEAGVTTGHHLIVFPEIVAGNPVCCNPHTGVCSNPGGHRNPLDAREKADVISRAASAYSRSTRSPRRTDAEYYRGYGRGMMDVAERHSAADTYYPAAANPRHANPYYVAHRQATPGDTDIVHSLRRRRDTFQRFERSPGAPYGGVVGPFRTGDEAVDSWGWAAPMARGVGRIHPFPLIDRRVAANPRHRGNPELAAAPFHPGTKISINEFESWLGQNGTADEKREYAKSKAAYKKFHLGAEPKSITREMMDVGMNRGVTDRGFGYGLGKSTHETYQAPKTSKKAGTIYVHKWETRPEAIATSDGRVIMKPLKGTARIDDWLRG